MVRVGLAALALTLGLSACVHLPNTALSKASVEGTYGALTPATPLAAIIQQQHIQPLDPAAKTPLLDQAMVALAKTDASGRHHGVTYDLTKDNKLERDWLVQTPDIWGRHSADLSYQPLDCKNCEPDFRLPFCEEDTDCRPTEASAVVLRPSMPRPPWRGSASAPVIRTRSSIASTA